MLMGRHSRRELLSNTSLARHLRSTRDCSEPRKVCILLRRGGLCWFCHHSDQTKNQLSDKHIRAIRDFPTPRNITDIRSWFGLINQVSYCDSLRNDMVPFREHRKPSSTFYWDDQLQQVFEQSKAAILNKFTAGVRIFDPKRVTCLATDWSKNGIGFWLLQKYCTCKVITPICCYLLLNGMKNSVRW